MLIGIFIVFVVILWIFFSDSGVQANDHSNQNPFLNDSNLPKDRFDHIMDGFNEEDQ